MAGFRFVRIDAPVGEGAPNHHFDVLGSLSMLTSRQFAMNG